MMPTTRRPPVPPSLDPVVAVVGEVVVRERHVDGRAAAVRVEAGADNLPAEGSPEARRLRRWIVHTLIEEAVVEVEGRAHGATGRDDPSDPLAPALVRQVFEAVTAGVTVTDAEIEGHYRRNLAAYARPEVRVVLQAVVAARSAARSLVVLAREHGLEAAMRVVGPGQAAFERHEVTPGRRGRAFDAAVFAAAPGAVVGPVEGPLGWLVAEVVEVRPATSTPLAEVRDRIAADLLAARRGRRFDDWLAARRRHLVRIVPGNEHPGDPRVPGHVHRH